MEHCKRKVSVGLHLSVLLIIMISCHAQFAPESDNMEYVPDVHFPTGNEFTASIGDTVTFPVVLENFNFTFCEIKTCRPMLCNHKTCFVQEMKVTENNKTLEIDCKLEVDYRSFYGTWGLHFDNTKFGMQQNADMEHFANIEFKNIQGRTPAIALIHINNATHVANAATPDILWCHDSDTFKYVKLDDPPTCIGPEKNKGYTEMGTLTVYTDNYKVQTQRAWTCQIIMHTIMVKCVNLQQTKVPQRDSIQSVDVDVCKQWYTDKSCQYGSMSSEGDSGGLFWKTDNPLKVRYNNWWGVCGIKGKPRYFKTGNCLMNEVDITYQAPFFDLFSAATGWLPLDTLTTHGAKRAFKTIAWSPKSSEAFMHVCRKVISLTVRVAKTTYSNMNAASEHKALLGLHIPNNDTVYQFMSTDESAVLYVAKEKDRTTLAALHAGSCGTEYPDTFTSNSLILQYVSESYLSIQGKARYTGVKHHPTLLGFHEDPLYSKANHHTNLWRMSNVSDTLMCGAVKMKSATHVCKDGNAVKKRERRQVNPQVPDIIQSRMDFLDAKQIMWSEKILKQTMYTSCLQQRQIHSLQTMQLEIDPSATFSSFTTQNVHVVPRGDIHSLQHCARLHCTNLYVVPSLETTFRPMHDVYKNKGVFISEHFAFYKPILQFNNTGHTVTGQLKTKYYLDPHLSFVGRQRKEEQFKSKENPVVDVKFFQICGKYYIFEKNKLISTVKVSDAGTEQHLIREYKKNRLMYRETHANENNYSSGTSVPMQIKTFATFAPVHLSLPKANFYGLRKASYYSQDAVLSQMYSMRDAIAATVRMQDAFMYTEAQIGRENIHSTVNFMGDVLDGALDVSVAGGKAAGGFLGSLAGSAAGLAVESFTGVAGHAITTFMDSIFARVVQIIGILGGYWAIIISSVYCGIAAYKRNWNIFIQSSSKSKCRKQVQTNNSDIAPSNIDGTHTVKHTIVNDVGWTGWLNK